jgi:hypothetical protein
MAADYQISTAGEHSPHAAPAVAGAVLIDDLLLVLEGTLVLTSSSSVPKASTAPDFRCSHSHPFAQFKDLLPHLGKRPLCLC